MSQLASPVEIYWISGSPFAWRVLLTAEIKGIPYEGKLLEASKGDLKTPEILAINPLGRVPPEKRWVRVLAVEIHHDRKGFVEREIAVAERGHSSSSVAAGDVRHSMAFTLSADARSSPRIPGPEPVMAK